MITWARGNYDGHGKARYGFVQYNYSFWFLVRDEKNSEQGYNLDETLLLRSICCFLLSIKYPCHEVLAFPPYLRIGAGFLWFSCQQLRPPAESRPFDFQLLQPFPPFLFFVSSSSLHRLFSSLYFLLPSCIWTPSSSLYNLSVSPGEALTNRHNEHLPATR